MLERALLYKLLARNVFVLVRQAHGEAKVDLGVGVLTGGAEFEHVTKAFLRAMHAVDAIVVVSDAVERVVSIHMWKTVLVGLSGTHLPM